jgi:threonine dehydratase
MSEIFSVGEIWKARARIAPYIYRTPLVYSRGLSSILDCSIYLKMECWQVCGCFKVRGAMSKVTALALAERQRGLVTASSGNHALAVAFAAGAQACRQATVFMPQNADPTKIEKVRAYPVRLELHGESFVEAYDRAREFCDSQGATFVHSHADPQVIAGQGTIGLEIVEDLPDVEVVVVPVGGGGLISGISTAVKSAVGSAQIYGAEPAAAPSAFMSLRDHKCYERIDIRPSIADGLLGGIGQLPYEIISRLVAGVAVLEDEEIARAVVAYQQEEQLMVEPASSVGLAALLAGKLEVQGKKVVLVITSRNVDANRYNRLVGEYAGVRDLQSGQSS